MSDPHQPPLPPHERDGCMTAILIAVGLLLLLPGVCALVIVGFDPKEALSNATTLIAFLTFLALGIGGVLVIRHALTQR